MCMNKILSTPGLKAAFYRFQKKGDLGKPENYRGITLTPIAAKVYNLMLLHRIQPWIEKNTKKKSKWFQTWSLL